MFPNKSNISNNNQEDFKVLGKDMEYRWENLWPCGAKNPGNIGLLPTSTSLLLNFHQQLQHITSTQLLSKTSTTSNNQAAYNIKHKHLFPFLLFFLLFRPKFSYYPLFFLFRPIFSLFFFSSFSCSSFIHAKKTLQYFTFSTHSFTNNHKASFIHQLQSTSSTTSP